MKRRDILKSAGAAGTGALLGNIGVQPVEAVDEGPPLEPYGDEIFVSTTGSDTAAGTETDPIRTLEEARDRIRNTSSLPSGGVAVTLRGGEYNRTSTFTLTSQDSGNGPDPIMYRAYDGEDVRITGGQALPSGDWSPISGTAKDRVPSSVEDDVMEIDLSGRGLDLGQLRVRGGLVDGTTDTFAPELFFDGSPQTLARWPNEGYTQTGTVIDDGGWYNTFTDSDGDGQVDNVPTWEYLDDRIEGWQDISDVWVYGYLGKLYSDQRIQVDSIDASANTITTKQSNEYPVEEGHDYYYLNVLEELDRPGEYFIDRDSSMLYFYPPDSLSSATVELSQFTGTMVEMTDVKYTSFQGITFQTSRGRGIVMHGGRHNRVYACTFDGLSKWAIEVRNDGSQSSLDNGVLGCDVVNTASGGIVLEGGDRQTLTPGDNWVVNCKIQNFNRIVHVSKTAVHLYGSGNRIAHNEFSDSDAGALHINGNEHTVEYNHVHHVVQKASDAGAIYTGRNPTERGNVIQYNYIHDVENPTDNQEIGVYIDDRNADVTVHGNVFVNCDLGIKVGGGRYNTVTNNLLLFCNRSLELDKRGLDRHDGTAEGCFANDDYYEHLSEFDLQSDPWASQYPGLKEIDTAYNGSSGASAPCVPRYNVIKRNVVHRSPEMTITDLSEDGFSFEPADVANNLQTGEDLGYTSPSNSQVTYHFDSSSLVKSQIPSWETIPFSEIGLDSRSENRLRQGTYDITESANQIVDVEVGVNQRAAVGEISAAVVIATKYDGTEYRFGEELSDSEVSLSSSDTGVLTVESDGTVVGQSTGTATLTATVDVSGVGTRTGQSEIEVFSSQSAFVTPSNPQTFANPDYTVKTWTQVNGPPFTMDGVVSAHYGTSSSAYGTIYSERGAHETFTAEAKLTTMGPTTEMGADATTGIYVQNDLTDPNGIGSAAIAVKRDGDIHLMWDSDGYVGQENAAPAPGLDSETVVSRSRSFPLWFRLEKDGTTFTASYSSDRTNWTQVGTATVPSAATTQDVGLAAGGDTGYSSSNTVEYGAWELSGTVSGQTESPVGRYPLDGVYARDYVRGTTGTITNSVQRGVSGQVGQAFSLAESNAAVETTPVDVNGSTFTATAWFRFSDHDSYGRILQAGGDPSTAPTDGWDLEFDSTNDALYLAIWGNGSHTKPTGTPTLSPNTWYFVAVVGDGDDYRVHVYDTSGELTNSPYTGTDGTRNETTSAPLVFFDGDAHATNGKIDEVRAYDRALTASEIDDVYDFDAPSPLATYPFQGSTMDVSGDGHHASGYGSITQGVSGVVRDAFGFDGTDDAVETPAVDINGSAFSATAWFKFTSHDEYGRLLQVGGDRSANPIDGWNVEFNSTNDYLNLGLWSGGSISKPIATDSLSTDTWYFVAVVGDGDDYRIHLFDEDGELSNSPYTGTNGNRVETSSEKAIAMAGSGSYTAGKMDELRLYDQALSTTQVRDLYELF